jgi:hypothetical protein
MPKPNQYKYEDPNLPWKWIKSSKGGYHMYYCGMEIAPNDLECFLNNSHFNAGLLIDLTAQILKTTPKLKEKNCTIKRR